MHNIPTLFGDDEALPEVGSDVLANEVFHFLCVATYLNNDDTLYTKYLTELSGDGRRLIRHTHTRLTTLFERDDRSN